MARIFMTGASGFVGSHVLPALLGAGHTVTALARNEKVEVALRTRYAAAASALQIHIGDVASPATLEGALRGHDAVVHLVALARDWNGGADLERINVGGTVNMLDTARRDGVRQFIHLGALGVEERASLHYASSKARAERAVRESGLTYTILKPSLMWGERDGFFNIVAALVKVPAPIVPVPGNGKSRFQPIWVGDVARVVVAAVQARFPESEVKFRNTVCQPTQQRQSAAERLAQRCDVVVVIGGAHSNNTRELVQTCLRSCDRVHHVTTAGDLRPEWFEEADTVGITAGTSTPDSTIQAVEAALRRIADSVPAAQRIPSPH